MKQKIKYDWWAVPPFLLEFFMFIVVMVYLGEVGLDNFLLIAGDDTLKLLFNISFFYMMAIFFLNGTFKNLKKFSNESEEELR